jgi:hypothetical protein
MIYSSLAVIALAASAVVPSASAAPSLGSLVHLHPHTLDSRVNVSLVNKSYTFIDVKIKGETYTVRSHETLFVKAPAGTVVYSNSFMPNHKVGDALLSITPAINNTHVVLD